MIAISIISARPGGKSIRRAIGGVRDTMGPYCNYRIFVLFNGIPQQDIIGRDLELFQVNQSLLDAGGRKFIEEKIVEDGRWEYVLQLDDDMTLIERGGLPLWRVMESEQKIGACGGMFKQQDDKDYSFCGYNHIITDDGFIMFEPNRMRGRWDQCTDIPDGFNMYRASLLKKGLRHDPTMNTFGAEIEFNWTIRDMGYQTGCCSKARALHAIDKEPVGTPWRTPHQFKRALGELKRRRGVNMILSWNCWKQIPETKNLDPNNPKHRKQLNNIVDTW